MSPFGDVLILCPTGLRRALAPRALLGGATPVSADTGCVPPLDEQLIAPATIEAIRRYRPDADEAINAALKRTRAALKQWDLLSERPLAGGAMSVVLLVTRSSVPMVLKVPLEGTTDVEAFTLRALRGAPHVTEASLSALLLEYLDGTTVAPDDAESVAAGLVLASSLWDCRDTTLFAGWRGHLHALLDEYATRIIANSPSHEIRALARDLLLEEEALAREPELVPSHGDLQAKNLLATKSGVRVIDPLAIMAPRGYDAAFAIVSAVTAGTDPRPILNQAQALGLGDLRSCLRTAAMVGAGATANVADVSVAQRLMTFLGEYSNQS